MSKSARCVATIATVSILGFSALLTFGMSASAVTYKDKPTKHIHSSIQIAQFSLDQDPWPEFNIADSGTLIFIYRTYKPSLEKIVIFSPDDKGEYPKDANGVMTPSRVITGIDSFQIGSFLRELPDKSLQFRMYIDDKSVINTYGPEADGDAVPTKVSNVTDQLMETDCGLAYLSQGSFIPPPDWSRIDNYASFIFSKFGKGGGLTEVQTKFCNPQTGLVLTETIRFTKRIPALPCTPFGQAIPGSPGQYYVEDWWTCSLSLKAPIDYWSRPKTYARMKIQTALNPKPISTFTIEHPASFLHIDSRGQLYIMTRVGNSPSATVSLVRLGKNPKGVQTGTAVITFANGKNVGPWNAWKDYGFDSHDRFWILKGKQDLYYYQF